MAARYRTGSLPAGCRSHHSDTTPAEWAAVGTLADTVAQGARVAVTSTDQHGAPRSR
ncbi:hypothetical protein [Microbacterium sp. GbtcB4]|uniref:hypothetical protein n=1 Tax=Microbacterium sp. GbtcB4 TaxID=2824749 RepID=UPI001C306682